MISWNLCFDLATGYRTKNRQSLKRTARSVYDDLDVGNPPACQLSFRASGCGWPACDWLHLSIESCLSRLGLCFLRGRRFKTRICMSTVAVHLLLSHQQNLSTYPTLSCAYTCMQILCKYCTDVISARDSTRRSA
jgi:hypothetical protein